MSGSASPKKSQLTHTSPGTHVSRSHGKPSPTGSLGVPPSPAAGAPASPGRPAIGRPPEPAMLGAPLDVPPFVEPAEPLEPALGLTPLEPALGLTPPEPALPEEPPLASALAEPACAPEARVLLFAPQWTS